MRKQLPVFNLSQTGAGPEGGRRRARRGARRGLHSPTPPQCQHGGQHPGSCLLRGSARGTARPQQPLQARGSGRLVTFGGRAAGAGREAEPGETGSAARPAPPLPPAAAGGRSGYFPAGQLRHLGATLREGTGGRSPSSPAAPARGPLKLQSGGGAGPACLPRPAPPARGSPARPRGAERSGRRPEGGGGRGGRSAVGAGAGRAGPPHKGRSPAAPCGHSPAAAAPCRCRSARRWAGSCG